MAKQIEITQAVWVRYIIPTFGNNHTIPYGAIMVFANVNGVKITKICKTKGDTTFDNGEQYITFCRKRYKVINQSQGFIFIPPIIFLQEF